MSYYKFPKYFATDPIVLKLFKIALNWRNNMDLKEIKKLINLVETANVSKLSVESNGAKIEINKELTSQAIQTIQHIAPSTQIPVPQPQTTTPEATNTAEKPTDENIVTIQSQMVGTFYSSANPEAPPYVKEGDTITKGQVVCIVEAMKLFNEIISEYSGTIVKCCVSNASPIEYGQDLYQIRLD
jgi:acetyl-CoA carboxylase biotin carboxyl carrier protein